MKKMLLATALALLIASGCAQQTLFKTNRQCFKGNHHYRYVSGIGQKKTVVQPKFVAENVKQKPSKH